MLIKKLLGIAFLSALLGMTSCSNDSSSDDNKNTANTEEKVQPTEDSDEESFFDAKPLVDRTIAVAIRGEVKKSYNPKTKAYRLVGFVDRSRVNKLVAGEFLNKNYELRLDKTSELKRARFGKLSRLTEVVKLNRGARIEFKALVNPKAERVAFFVVIPVTENNKETLKDLTL